MKRTRLKRKKGLPRGKPGQATRRKGKPKQRANPSSRAAKKRADKLWREVILKRCGYGCVVCGATGRLEAHHLIRRDAIFYRHNPENGVALCYQHHTGSSKESAHGAPWWFEAWVERARPDQYEWWEKNRYEVITGQKINYEQVCDVLQDILDGKLLVTHGGIYTPVGKSAKLLKEQT
ncbi:MAG TPA: HNH endonuclease [Phycisphaerae bacterium]|nr:HNH endonuclease [Phycisphaerae bacterium]